MTSLYFEDFTPGATFSTPGVTFTEEAIIRFALEWDNQTIHVDRQAAERSGFGGIIASGLHSMVMGYRLWNQLGLVSDSMVAGIGLDNVRFTAPLRPGDRLTSRVTVLTARGSATRPGEGVVTLGLEACNQHDQAIMTMQMTMLLRRRPGPAANVGTEP